MDPVTLALLGGGMMAAKGIGGMYAANQQRVAARDQLRAAGRAQGAITDAYGKAQGYQQPYLQAGQIGLDRMTQGNYDTAVPQYEAGDMPGPYQSQAFNYQEDPGMAYRMRTGQEAVQSGAAARGSGLSGSTLKALARFGSDLGSQEYGAAYNRYAQDQARNLQGYQTNLGRAQDIRDTGWGAGKDMYTMGNQQATQRYGMASDLGTMGQSAAGNLSNMASEYGSNLAGLYGTQGQIKAGGRIAAAQTTANTIGGMADTGMDMMTLGSLGGRPQARYGERML